jgi:hypothetical protein
MELSSTYLEPPNSKEIKFKTFPPQANTVLSKRREEEGLHPDFCGHF